MLNKIKNLINYMKMVWFYTINKPDLYVINSHMGAMFIGTRIPKKLVYPDFNAYDIREYLNAPATIEPHNNVRVDFYGTFLVPKKNDKLLGSFENSDDKYIDVHTCKRSHFEFKHINDIIPTIEIDSSWLPMIKLGEVIV